ncbi:MAG: hypothetical protein AUJ92_03915 [Armatimonadetes bacterium CG2_30_59_28]|nr:LPS export ABC transporter periplasmic protein LptC [Armatimonadota bacterium]OIO97299.1 MAG: hypothetical protein AUJ92_03915 [Armatimonadetes bacterium CG2_30_59_28]PIU61362.1 MAG: hypothetical protein COS85_21185 [Armatimonadetes bacterium CG07_land_8_20_14_0_80_59_28]PIX38787.1 MAG: hypothetical protein COZ56_19545 [Armatimonadetes bacterium CG_4_8_14_3_um_filter_58_9]PIY40840.1 MAG: hypothetical protein COZ05_16625 [Armatimonadetes bacterium CG_4_10_14_3_um_filter_59_10]
MKGLSRQIGITVLLLAMVGVTLWVWQQREPPEAAKSLSPLSPADIPSDLGLEIAGVNGLIIRSNGKKQWELTAKKIAVSKDKTLIEVDDLQKAAYFRAGKEVLNLSASRLRFNSQSRNLEIIGNVRLNTIHGLILTTSRVLWDSGKRRITCPKAVEARVKRLFFKTVFVSFEPDTARLTCPREVRMTFGMGGFMRANRLSANLTTEIVDLTGSVFCKARIGKLKMPFSL